MHLRLRHYLYVKEKTVVGPHLFELFCNINFQGRENMFVLVFFANVDVS
jgi:uncharacterized protein YbcI